MSKPVKKRQGIDNITRIKICQFVASQPVPPSTKIVRDWAEATFNRKFPQSTLSTLLRSNGLQIKQAGGRGRRCLAGTTIAKRPDTEALSKRTQVPLAHLKLLADGRYRGRSSEHPHIELCFLEETYLLLQATVNSTSRKIGVSWFQALTRRLFKEHNEPLPKNISQFLNQIYDKYYLVNMVYQHMHDGLEFNVMRERLSEVYPGLKVVPQTQQQYLPAYNPTTPPPEPVIKMEDPVYAEDNIHTHTPLAVQSAESYFMAPPSPFPSSDDLPPTTIHIPLASSNTDHFQKFLPVHHHHQQLAPPTPPMWDPQQQHNNQPQQVDFSHSHQHIVPSTAFPMLTQQPPVHILDPTTDCIMIPAMATTSFGSYQEHLDLGYNMMLDNVFDS